MKMPNSQQLPDYRLYPSLLDSYQWYKSSESETSEQELLNKINRLPFTSEAADKGTWFNELIDLSLKGLSKYKLEYLSGPAQEIASRLQGAAKQIFTSTLIEIDGKLVELYGYIDYMKLDRTIDLKTTKEYKLGKYKDSLQLHFYPVSLIDEGNEINEFEFLVCDFDNVYSEVYDVNYDVSKNILMDACRELIRFIEIKKDLITDKKIFGLENVVIAERDFELNAIIVS